MNWKVHSQPTGNALTDAQTYEFEDVAHLFDGQHPYRLETYTERARTVVNTFHQNHRNRLADALFAYMQRLGAQQANLDLALQLKNPEAVVVVTGQQAGLFTGPMYAVTKALSAIGVAKSMSESLGRPVLPVFWIASEDHDFAEVNHAYVLNPEDEAIRIALPLRVPAHQMVYHTALPQDVIEETLRQVQQHLPEGPDKVTMLKDLQAAYEPGMSLSTWFAKIMLRILSSHPLIILDPCLPELRALVAPVWLRALEHAEDVQDRLQSVYQEVSDAGFSPEVVRDTTNTTLFYVENGSRYVLELAPNGQLRARGHGKTQSVQEWIALAEQDPCAFSSNVLLRPVVQDFLLPTLAYVGGPSEIAYHPLSRAVFHTHQRTLPPLLMRQRVTFFLPSVLRNMMKWDVGEDEVLVRPDLVTPILDSFGAKLLTEEFAGMKFDAAKRWEAFGSLRSALGPQVKDMVEAHVRRELSSMERLERKMQMLLASRHKDEVQQLRHIEHWLWPNGRAQERFLCPLNLWAKFGSEVFGQVPVWGDLSLPAPVYHVYLD